MGVDGSVLDFTSEVDTTEEGWSMTKTHFKRLLLWPVIPDFGERMDMDVCGGDAAVIQLHTALCTLHADMRVKEMICDVAEDVLRTKAEGGTGCALVVAFNATCKDVLKIRHKIAADEDGKVRRSALDGKDCKLLNADWLLLEHDELTADPPKWKKEGSKYFASLAANLAKLTGSHELLIKLGKVATFVMLWIEGGHNLKGYGWHLWTSLITLYRRYGCLESISVPKLEEAIFTELQMEMLYAVFETLHYSQKLKADYAAYYKTFPSRHRGEVDDFQFETEMRARKKDYRDKIVRERQQQALYDAWGDDNE
jgi:hypothetical protein